MYAKYKPVKDLDFYISDKCCDVMKKRPLHQFYKQTGKCAITASMAQESKRRESNWITYGCNLFDAKIPVSNPMSFWTEQDVLQYIQEFNLRIAPVYGEIYSGIVTTRKHGQPRKKEERLLMTGCSRTGCIFCSFGICFEKTKKETRFEMLKRTHPVQYDYCMNGGKHNEEGIWVPSKEGLGMKYVFDSLNNIYGEGFIRY